MSKSKHTEPQIRAALKEVEAGRSAWDVALARTVSRTTSLGSELWRLEVMKQTEAKTSPQTSPQ